MQPVKNPMLTASIVLHAWQWPAVDCRLSRVKPAPRLLCRVAAWPDERTHYQDNAGHRQRSRMPLPAVAPSPIRHARTRNTRPRWACPPVRRDPRQKWLSNQATARGEPARPHLALFIFLRLFAPAAELFAPAAQGRRGRRVYSYHHTPNTFPPSHLRALAPWRLGVRITVTNQVLMGRGEVFGEARRVKPRRGERRQAAAVQTCLTGGRVEGHAPARPDEGCDTRGRAGVLGWRWAMCVNKPAPALAHGSRRMVPFRPCGLELLQVLVVQRDHRLGAGFGFGKSGRLVCGRGCQSLVWRPSDL